MIDLESRTWLSRHCRGDTGAFPALLEAYRRPVFGYLVRSGVAAADREDIFQSIFLKVHAAAKSYDPARPLKPWLFTIVANTVRNHFRSRPAHLVAVTGGDPPETTDPNPGPEQVAEARETLAWLEQALLALPPAQREVLLLATVIGLPQQEIAEALHLPLNTVKTHLRRARLALAAGRAEREATDGCHGDTDEAL
ncbi:MAG: RNA polymerase sigma factor [Alphaproteobacteria bacterium]|nr:RNA polymerase sigma factor [Alphaproteobacteria bacterium]